MVTDAASSLLRYWPPFSLKRFLWLISNVNGDCKYLAVKMAPNSVFWYPKLAARGRQLLYWPPFSLPDIGNDVATRVAMVTAWVAMRSLEALQGAANIWQCRCLYQSIKAGKKWDFVFSLSK
jgi:hypothetical protein